MSTKRALALVASASIAITVALPACTESKSNPTLHPYTGPRDAAAETSTSTDTSDASSTTQDSGTSDAADAGSDAPPAVVESYLSDLNVDYEGGYGPLEKDMSNGDMGAADGVMMKIQNVMYMKGLGVHAISKTTFNLGGQYKAFLAEVGIDDETMGQGSVVFRVVVDGDELFNSMTMTGNDAAKSVNVDVTGKNTLELFVDDADDGNGNDHADWAMARVRK